MKKIILYKLKGKINLISSSKSQLKLLQKSVDFLFENNKEKLKINFRKKPIFTILVSKITPYYNEFFLKENIFVLGDGYFKKQFAYKEFLASLILHEMKHLEQFQNGKKFTGKIAETEGYKVQRNFLENIRYESAVKWLDNQYKKQWWKEMDKKTIQREKTIEFFNNFKENKFKIKEL
jgi:hypothetical protein